MQNKLNDSITKKERLQLSFTKNPNIKTKSNDKSREERHVAEISINKRDFN